MTTLARLASLMYDIDLLRFRLALGRRTMPWSAR